MNYSGSFFFIMRFELKYYFAGFKPFLRVRGLLFR